MFSAVFAFLARKGGIALAISQEKQTNVEWLMARGNVAKHTMVARDEAFYRLSNRASTAIVHNRASAASSSRPSLVSKPTNQ